MNSTSSNSASSQTTVSYNEIVMFCRKALEGLGVSSGELEDAADAVGWLALHGIDGLTAFHELLAELPQKSPSQPLSDIVFDGAGSSCLLIGPTLLDIGFAQATLQQNRTLTLKNCRHPLFMVAYMIRCAGRGVHIAACWQEIATASHLVITVAPTEPFPTISHTFADSEKEPQLIPSRDLVDLTLHFSPNNPLDLSNIYAPQDPHSRQRDYTPAHFQAQRRHRIEQGISIDAAIWAAIQEIGKLVLVEATEESRQRGAGENA